MSRGQREPRPPEYGGAIGSAFLLVKTCDDGHSITLQFATEAELRTHLEAMWRVTPQWHLTAVVKVQKDGSLKPLLASR